MNKETRTTYRAPAGTLAELAAFLNTIIERYGDHTITNITGDFEGDYIDQGSRVIRTRGAVSIEVRDNDQENDCQ